MRPGNRFMWPLPLLLLLLLPACDKSAPPTESIADPAQETAASVEESGSRTPFGDAEVFFEFNTTDNDLGLQVFLDAVGWQKVTVADPQGDQIVRIVTEGKLSELGITEVRFESAEPLPAEVLDRFPPGDYGFRGQTVEGVTLVSRATLSHDFLPAPTLSPRDGQVVDPKNTVVEWSAPGAERVEIIIQSDALTDKFDVTVTGETSRLSIPRQFLQRGTEYRIEILAIGENRNRTIVESTFVTEP